MEPQKPTQPPRPAPESSGMAYGAGTMGGSAPTEVHKSKKQSAIALGIILLVIIAIIGTVLAST